MIFKKTHLIGISFGLTSGIITTLGLMVGLNASTQSKLAVIGGIITIAVADAFSDAMGIHISEESKQKTKSIEIWEATIRTFIAKFIFSLSFLIPVLIFELNLAMIIALLWGGLLLSIFSFYIARIRKEKALFVIGEHLFIALLVVFLTYILGGFINKSFV